MQHGDISNQRSFVIGFRCEDSLLKYRDDSLGDKVMNVIKGKTNRAEVDPKVYSLMNYLYWNTEYTVMLVIDEKNYTKEAQEYLSDFPFNQVVTVLKNISEVTMMLNTGELTYFVSQDILDRQRANSKYAVSVDEFNTILKRRVKRFE
mgnify:CR=1 FL=1